ncbi:hypothetical protein QMO56_21415 [Roseomonas sp. E05]|uniref:hypothetical protein n=1 Tax=Roseomonas sp. E05 TaxID=3046310 RepID=UPI0024BBEA99|nr:hypothetical protein [Roseomonas sp. E05]MDJ0390678.1 hypothetical protein [Roseomonas sp. E05]
MSDTTVAAERPKGAAENAGRDPLRDVLDRMNRAREHVAAIDPHLSDTIRLLTERAEQPGRTESTNFRIRVAYALQDLEKLAGPVVNMSEPMRQEMARLATTMPGLQNERLQELMRRTPEIQDVGLVRDIRVIAADAATRPAQDTASIRDRVEVLESRARLSGLPSLPLASTAHAEAESTRRTPEAVNDPASTGTPGSHTGSAERGMGARSATHQEAASPEPMRAASPDWRSPPQQATRQPEPDQDQSRVQAQLRAPGLVASIMAAMHKPDQQRAATLDPTPTPMVERVSRFEQRMQEGREENSFRGAEQSGRAALEALQAFASGPGASVMNRIREAAKADPGGIAGVMSEMRTGGVYADLRQQFDGAMAKEKSFAAAYERAAAATGQYAKDRTAVEAIISQRPDAEALTGRFQKLDAQIGEATSSTPGRKEGKNALDELAEKAAEIISRALDRVKAAFSSSARAGSSPSPSP